MFKDSVLGAVALFGFMSVLSEKGMRERKLRGLLVP